MALALAEATASSGRWIIRVASAAMHGGGHLARMQVLAMALRRAGAEVHFILDQGSDPARDALCRAGFRCVGRSAVSIHKYSGIILDGYEILEKEAEWFGTLVAPLVVMDDFLRPPAQTSLAINSAFHLSGDRIGSIPALLGPKYALVNSSYAQISAKDCTQPVRQLLLSFGRLGAAKLLWDTLDTIASVAPSLKVVVTAPSSLPELDAFEAKIESFGKGSTLLVDPPDLIDALRQSDFVIGSGGVSLLERMAAGVPSLTLAQAENHNLMIQGAVALGACFGTDKGQTSMEAIAKSLGAALRDGRARAAVSEVGKRLVDGRGGDRTAEKIISLSNAKNCHPRLSAAGMR